MASSIVNEPNLKKNDFSRLKKTQHILANKFMRESIVAVSRIYKKYAVMLIYASYCLSAVEANGIIRGNNNRYRGNNNSNMNQTQSDSKDSEEDSLENLGTILTIVGIIVSLLSVIIGALQFYYQTLKEEPNAEQVDKIIEIISKNPKDAEDIEIYEELQNLKNKVEMMEIIPAEINPFLVEKENKV